MKRYICLVIIMLFLFTSAANASAQYIDVPEDASYKDALERLVSLGIISGNENGEFNPDGLLTREQYAKIIVMAANISDTSLSASASKFSDVSPKKWSSSYINIAVNKGFLVGTSDRKFHPEENITYAQACTVFLRMLGYSDSDLQGVWPQNYMDKAKSIGLTKGLSFQKNDALPRWAAVVMLDRLFTTPVKKASSTETDLLYSKSTGLFSECTVLADSSTTKKLALNEVQTDQGILYKQEGMKLEVGKKYRLKLDDDNIEKVYDSFSTVKKITVVSVDGTKVTYKENNSTQSITLPMNTAYYYNGSEQKYDTLKTILKRDQVIYLGGVQNSTGNDYAVISDPYDDAMGTYTECIILDDASSSNTLTSKQVRTDKGIYTLSSSVSKLELGATYGLYINDDTVVSIQSVLNTVSKTTVLNAVGSRVTLKDSLSTNTAKLPENITYYYNGAKKDYDSISDVLQMDSSIIWAFDEDKSAYDYALVYDPVCSPPYIYGTSNANNISMNGNDTVIRNGQYSSANSITSHDVIYEITDLWNENRYFKVVDNKVEGFIVSIPSIVSPKTVTINELTTESSSLVKKVYSFSEYVDINHIKFFSENDYVYLILDSDGKVIEIVDKY